MNTYNFSAGPAALPKSVMVKMQQELLNYGNAKASVMEISHRSADFMALAQKAEASLRLLLNIPDNYKVLFAQGGASAQFAMVPINLLNGKKITNYVNTGHWSKKAIYEANRYSQVNICTDSSSNNWTDIADFKDWRIDKNAAYLHYCSNETIAGLEFDYIPFVDDDMPLVVDMSSNILSNPIDVSKFGVIYAGTQKNIGIAGLTIIIVREDLLGNVLAKQPTLYDYNTYVNNYSMYNTPATFAWYAASLVFEWLDDLGGVEAIAKINQEKAKILYDFIDNSSFYYNSVNNRYRSIMNVPFFLADNKLDKLFLEESFNKNLLALKGHRLLGGMRASIYNAMPKEGVIALVDFMAKFEQKYG